MTRRAAVILALVSVGVAVLLGAIDYETHGLGELLSAENVPALVLFAILAFIVLSGCYLAVITARKGLASRRRLQRTRGTL